ncbi:Heat shock 22 kDa protein [Hibiscus syriacus]|uniref:Heat shock 22 kDa protein n=1 Tax=Hibiscus syriacus TaxID=106335 RepID=A0A6A3CER5_HIBSY|nr:Heat shock 22 kDa protein [Hibiscus syriacus]
MIPPMIPPHSSWVLLCIYTVPMGAVSGYLGVDPGFSGVLVTGCCDPLFPAGRLGMVQSRWWPGSALGTDCVAPFLAALMTNIGNPSVESGLDVLDPFSPTRSLSQVLNLMDQFTDHPFLSSPEFVLEERNTLIIRGEGGKEWNDDDEDSGRRYSSRLDLPPTMYKLDDIKAEMKNGVLKVIVPKVKEEDRKDVYQVTVE